MVVLLEKHLSGSGHLCTGRKAKTTNAAFCQSESAELWFAEVVPVGSRLTWPDLSKTHLPSVRAPYFRLASENPLVFHFARTASSRISFDEDESVVFSFDECESAGTSFREVISAEKSFDEVRFIGNAFGEARETKFQQICPREINF